MNLMVLTDDEMKEEFLKKKIKSDTKITFIKDASDLDYDADAIFILKEIELKEIANFANPVFLNSVIKTLKEQHLPENYSRFIGWPTFLQRETWEIATNSKKIDPLFKKLEWNYITVKDEPGLVSARTIAMIINEAYFALGDAVSSKQEVDIAMKLGTNYPFGPFEWAQKIGLKNIYLLLKKLSEKDSRYIVAPFMEKELNENII